MRVMIGTLFHQGQLHSNFHRSMLDLLQRSLVHRSEVARLARQQIGNFDDKNPQHMAQFDQIMWANSFEIGEYSLSGESLLSRGRNHIAQAALTQGFDKLLFIDSDEGFTWDDFITLVTSPHPIAAGLVPLKTFPIPGTFKTSLNYLPFLEDEIYFDGSLRTLDATLRMAKAKGTPWVEVAFTGTGFLCVDTSVFALLAEHCEEYLYPNPTNGQPEVHWSFFDGGPIDDRYMSEDWTFCDFARRHGLKIMVNTNVRATHMGPHLYVAG